MLVRDWSSAVVCTSTVELRPIARWAVNRLVGCVDCTQTAAQARDTTSVVFQQVLLANVQTRTDTDQLHPTV